MKMTDAEYQDIWDKNLINSWTLEYSGWAIAAGFLKDIGSDLVDGFSNREADFKAISKLLVSCNLSRCLDKRSGGGLEFRPSKTARAFVAEHCDRMNTCLWSGKHTEEAILDSINNFKWLKKGSAIINYAHNKSQKKRRASVYVPIKLRGLSKKHDWNTVK